MEWFNNVDATYRSDLRELNELNFARFDAKLEQRTSEIETRLDAKIDRLEARLDARIDRLEGKLEQRIAELRAELIKWMFLFWAGTVVPLGALIVALMR